MAVAGVLGAASFLINVGFALSVPVLDLLWAAQRRGVSKRVAWWGLLGFPGLVIGFSRLNQPESRVEEEYIDFTEPAPTPRWPRHR